MTEGAESGRGAEHHPGEKGRRARPTPAPATRWKIKKYTIFADRSGDFRGGRLRQGIAYCVMRMFSPVVVLDHQQRHALARQIEFIKVAAPCVTASVAGAPS